MITWYYGNTGAGKTTAARKFADENKAILLDGDEMRKVWNDLGLSKGDRIEQNIRIASLAMDFNNQGFDVVVATICPYIDLRKTIKETTGCQFIFVPGGKSGPEYPFEMDE